MVEIASEVFHHIRRIQIQTTRTVDDVLAGAYHSAFKGRGMEFEDVRAYQPGDEIRSIDWNVTARMHYPYVKNFREERELTVMLVVDASASTRFGSAVRSKKNLIAEIAAVLAFSAIKNNDKVGLLLFSDRIEQYLPPKKGLRHVLRVIRELLVHETSGTGTDLNQALRYLAKVQKRKGVCFLLSDLCCGLDTATVATTARRHDLIALAVNDPMDFDLPPMGLARLHDFESGNERWVDTQDPSTRASYAHFMKGRRESHEHILRKAGAGFLSISTGESYIHSLRSFFQQRERRR
ncbi:MAG: DUF58 domain-containing protein [Chlamydiia bacterium]|nr:DUF58 domain-containing protein [Chlamydiia bacterium]